MAGENGTNSAENPQLSALDRQIQAHEEADKNRSWIGYVASQVWRGDRTTLSQLKETSQQSHLAEQQGDKEKLATLTRDAKHEIQADKKAVHTQDQISFYTSSGVKMAALMFGAGRFGLSAGGLLGLEGAGAIGGIGMASTVGLYAADAAKVGDTSGELGKHLLLGGAQGLVTKGLFNGVATAGLGSRVLGLGEAAPLGTAAEAASPMLQSSASAIDGMLFGVTSRGSELAFNANTYHDAKGNTSLAEGAKNLLSGTFDPKAMAVDGAMFGLTHSAVNAITGGAALRPFYRTTQMSGALGLASGAYGEYENERNSGQPIDLGEIAKRALLQGAIYTVAGIPGGLAGDAAFRRQPVQTVKEDLSRGADNLKAEAGDLKNKIVDGLTPPPDFFGGMRPAYAMAGPSLPVRAGERAAITPPEPLGGSISMMNRPDSGDGAGPMLMEGTLLDPSRTLKSGDTANGAFVKNGRLVDQWTDMRGEAERNIAPDELVDRKQQVEKWLTSIPNERPVRQQMDDAYMFFGSHPELDSHVADLYFSNYNNLGMRRLIDGFYNTPRALERDPSLAAADVRQRFDKLTRRLEEPGTWDVRALELRQGINTIRRDLGADLTPAVEQYGRLTRNPNVAYAIDLALRDGGGNWTTNFSGILEAERQLVTAGHQPRMRSLPFTPEQSKMLNSDEFVHGSADGVIGTMGDALNDALAAKAKAGELAPKSGEPGSADKPTGIIGPDASEVAGTSTDKGTPSVAQTILAQRIASKMADLESPLQNVRQQARAELSRQPLVGGMTEQQYDVWFDHVRQSLTAGKRRVIDSEEVQKLPKDLVRSIVEGDWSAAATNDQDFSDGLYRKFSRLQDMSKQYGDSPEALAALAKLGKNDPVRLQQVFDNTMSGKFGALNPVYRDYAIKELPSLTSLEPLAGPTGLTRSMLHTAVPDIADRLMQLAANDPTFKVDELAKKFAFNRDAEAIKQTVRDMFGDGKPEPTTAQLNPDYVMKIANPDNIFYGYKEAGKMFMHAIEGADPNAVVDLLKRPYEQVLKPGKPKGPRLQNPDDAYNKAYANLLAELVQRGATFEQLTKVGDSMRKITRTDTGRRGLDPAQAIENAEAAIADIIPRSDVQAFGLANQVAEGVITKNNDMVKEVIGKSNKPGWLAEKSAADPDDGAGTDGGPKPPADPPQPPADPPQPPADPPQPPVDPPQPPVDPPQPPADLPKDDHTSGTGADRDTTAFADPDDRSGNGTGTAVKGATEVVHDTDANGSDEARGAADEGDKRTDVDNATQAAAEQQARIAAIDPNRLAELVKLHEMLGTKGDDTLVSKLSEKVADSPIANPQLPKVLRQGKAETLPDGTEVFTFASKGQAEKLLDKVYSKLAGATGASESESEPFAHADANGRYWPMLQLGMPDGRQIIVTPTFDSAGKVVGISKLADGQMVEAANAPSQDATVTQPIEQTEAAEPPTSSERDTNHGGETRDESKLEVDNAEPVAYDKALEEYEAAVQELDTDLKLGGSAEAFAKVAQALAGDKPLSIGRSMTLVDGMPTFGATVASEPRLPVLKEGAEVAELAQQINDYLSQRLPKGSELSFETLDVQLDNGDVHIPFVQVLLPGESEPIRGVPVMNLSGQMTGLSTLGALEKPSQLKTLDATEMEDARTKLAAMFNKK